MPVVTVKAGELERRIAVSGRDSVRDILESTDMRVRSGCGGRGACGLCKVLVEAGEANSPTPVERIHLDQAELDEGVRLACQLMPESDLQIEILASSPKSNWRTPIAEAARPIGRSVSPPAADIPPNVKTPLGAAVDLGTTHISVALHELSSGARIAARYGSNPQIHYGSDVVTRLIAAAKSSELAFSMSRQVVAAIGEALLDMALREGIDIRQVIRVAVVGNTAMLALLSGRNFESLLQPSQWTTRLDCLPKNPSAWAAEWSIHPRAEVMVLPPLAGFVGSDLTAGIVATHLMEAEGALFIDFGTNSEIALWDGRLLRVTSVAGGPAFEECGMSCGAPAESGAIFRVDSNGAEFHFAVIDDAKPCGVCGSGLVDLLACLARSGLLTEKGRFAASVPDEGFTLLRGEKNIVLTKRDVDLFQRAKAAVGAAVEVLLTEAAMDCEDLKRVCVGGFFGRFLDIDNARKIGLLPMTPPDRIELCGNTALSGCADALLSKDALELFGQLGTRAMLIDLPRHPGFEDLFLKNLYLLPLTGN